MSPILIVGATGTVGRQVTAQLADAGVPVRALARNPDVVPLPPQAERVRADLTVPETLEPALDGVDSVFLVWTAPRSAAEAALERILRRARRIVYLSAPYKTPHPFFQQPNPGAILNAAIEKQIEASGVEWTFLRPGMFAADALGFWAPQIRMGDLVRWPYLDAPTAPIDERDVAAAGVRALTGDGHAGAEYIITGSESLTQREQIEIIGRALGRWLRTEDLSPEEARRSLFADWPPVVVDMLFNAWSAAIAQPAYVSATFAELMSRPPRTLFEWAKDHAAAFR